MIYAFITLIVAIVTLAMALVYEMHQHWRALHRIARLEMQLQSSIIERNTLTRRCLELERKLERHPHPDLDPPPYQCRGGVAYPIYYN